MNVSRVLAEMRRLGPRPSHDRADESRARATLYPRARVGIDAAPRECPISTGGGTPPGVEAAAAAGSHGREAGAPLPVGPHPEERS